MGIGRKGWFQICPVQIFPLPFSAHHFRSWPLLLLFCKALSSSKQIMEWYIHCWLRWCVPYSSCDFPFLSFFPPVNWNCTSLLNRRRHWIWRDEAELINVQHFNRWKQSGGSTACENLSRHPEVQPVVFLGFSCPKAEVGMSWPPEIPSCPIFCECTDFHGPYWLWARPVWRCNYAVHLLMKMARTALCTMWLFWYIPSQVICNCFLVALFLFWLLPKTWCRHN